MYLYKCNLCCQCSLDKPCQLEDSFLIQNRQLSYLCKTTNTTKISHFQAVDNQVRKIRLKKTYRVRSVGIPW